MIGKRIAQFEILKELGRGGMSTVYLAQDTRLNRQVALKFPSTELTKDSSAHKRFLQEARSAAALNHPYICNIFEVGTGDTPEDTYIVMEYVRGETLEARLSRGALPPGEAVRYGQEIAEALSVAHRGGLIHRDLKPGNVMITAADHIKIMDFGLAKQTAMTEGTEASTAPLATESGSAPGTVPYMSPEQVRNESLTTVSDLFPLGIVLYEMLTGRHPFAGSTMMETAAAILHREPAPLSGLLKGCPPLLDRTVEHLLKKNPDARLQAAAEAETALRLLNENPKALARIRYTAQAAPAGPGPFRTRRWIAAAAVTLVAAVALATAWIQFIGGSDPAPNPPSTDALTPRELNGHALDLLDRYDREGSLDRAEEFLIQALELDPKNAPAMAGLAQVDLLQYDVEKDPALLQEAADHAARAVEFNPHLALARCQAGLAAMEQGNYDRARHHLDEGLIREPRNARLHQAYGYLYQKLAVRDSADMHFRIALQEDPEDWQTYLLYGAFLFHDGRYAEAESVFATALGKAEDNHLLYFNLAGAQHMLDETDKAAANYQTSLEIRPSAAAYSNLGTLLFFQGHFGHAASAYESAIEEGVSDYLMWANLADSYRWIPGEEDASRRAYREAIDKLNALLAESPRDPTLLTRKAEYLAKFGDRRGTVDVLRDIETLEDLDLEARYCVVLANELIGRREESLKHLGLALERGFPVSFIEQDPELGNLREDPAYRRLVRPTGG